MCTSAELNTIFSPVQGQTLFNMPFQHIVLHNLVNKSAVLRGMVEDCGQNDNYVTEDDYVFFYKTYDDLTLRQVLDGFSLTLEEVTYVAFGIVDRRGQRAADLLQCDEYIRTLVDFWIRKESPWKPEDIIHREIMMKPEFKNQWLKKITRCIHRNDSDAVRRLWIDTPQAIDLWKSVRNYDSGMVFIENGAPISGPYVNHLIRTDQQELLEELLKRKKVDPNGVYNKQTYLMFAVLKHKKEIVKLFLEYGANPNTKMYGLSALACAETQICSYDIYNTLLTYIEN